MSFNGSGTFVINTAGQPVVANTVISATVFNALTSDLATGLSTCITKDGQTTVTANIPFGNNKITSLGAGTAATDASNMSQVQSTAAKLITVTGTDTITGTMSPALASYAAGQLFYFIANAANTGAMTINIDGLGAKSITRDGSTALIAGDVNTGEIVVICYDGTRFQMINAANSFGNTTINGTLTVTGNTGLQANVSITSALSVGGVFAVTGAATLGSTLAVTGKSDLPTVSTASMNAAVAVVTTGTVTNLTSTSASIASMNAGVALLTNATVTTLTATGASIASANIGNLQFTAASIASINAGVAVITNLTATSASIASVNAGVALLTTATITGLTATGASIASANAGTATLSGNLTLTGGTADGVLYLNASKVATSGTALIFDGSKLGIGGTPPTTLYVKGTAGGTDPTVVTGERVRIQSNDTTGRSTYLSTIAGTAANSGILFGDQDAADVGRILYAHGTNSLQFFTNSAEVARFDSSGDLGIGVTPSIWNAAGYKALEIGAAGTALYGGSKDLYVNANVYFDGTWKYATTATAGQYNINEATHKWFNAASGTAGNTITWTQAMTLDASGNLGIGTASPAAKLHVVGDALANTFKLITNTTVSGSDATIFRPADNTLAFSTNGAERARFDTSGNFGLGVTPSAWSGFKVLELQGGYVGGGATSYIEFGQNNYYDGAFKYKTTAAATLYEQASGAHKWFNAASGTAGNTITFTQAMTLDASGNLLVGTTTTSSLAGAGRGLIEVNGSSDSAFAMKANNTLYGYLYNSASEFRVANVTSNPVTFFTNNTERARITSAGDLGIGTASPAQKLEVAGNVRLSGSQVGSKIENQMTSISVTTSATTILDVAGSYGRLVVVNGGSGSDRFCDLVLASTGVSPTVVSSFTALGSPAARTYTRSGVALQLAMASGTYTVWALALGF